MIFKEWTDTNLIWNKSEYGDIQDIRIPPKYIWKPDLLMYNRYEDTIALNNLIGGVTNLLEKGFESFCERFVIKFAQFV